MVIKICKGIVIKEELRAKALVLWMFNNPGLKSGVICKGIIKEELRAKALVLWMFNNPGLKSGVIGNEVFTDFSPKSVFLLNSSITIII
jgi:hypothetical protein